MKKSRKKKHLDMDVYLSQWYLDYVDKCVCTFDIFRHCFLNAEDIEQDGRDLLVIQL